MADNTSQVTPPFANPEYDYETQKAQIPREQTLFFCSNLAEGSWIPSQYTNDETKHLLPDGWARLLFDGRKFQHAWMVQGQSETQHFNIIVLKPNGAFDDFSKYVGDGEILENKLITFIGTDAAGNFRRSDVGFEGSQASLGEIGWKPEAILASVPGHYKSARFVLEDPDRHKQIPLLEFDLQIFANDEIAPTPSVYRPYISEFERALYRISELYSAGQDQLAYIETIYAAIIKQKLQDLNDQMDDAKKQIDDTTAYGKTQIDSMVKDAQNQLTVIKSDVAKLEDTVKADNLVTTDNMLNLIQGFFDNNQIKLSETNSDNDVKLEKMKKELEGNK